MTETWLANPREAALESEITRLNRIIAALMDRAERDMGGSGTDFCMFQTTVTLENQIHERTRALEAAIHEIEQINRALKREKEEQRQLIEQLEAAQRQLVQSEKLASLGALVAGIAHELNTPIGNAVMAASTLQSTIAEFRAQSADGLKRSMLDKLLAAIDTGTDIAGRNLRRAAELISSFKQVAADQTSAQRRSFDLAEMIDKVMLTLQPSLRGTIGQVDIDIAREIVLDSYPGPLGQILTNLVGNVAAHAFEGRPPGRMKIAAARLDAQRIALTVEDDGIGISGDFLPRIFDPFVTSKMGRGGTGLGLHIAHNIAVQVLGGQITASSQPGHGTRFVLEIPLKAPMPRSTGKNPENT